MKKVKQEKIEEYLKQKVSIIFERLMVELLAARPDSVVDWSINWLETKGREIERKGLHSAHSQKTMPEIVHVKPEVKKPYYSDEDEDEDEEIDELPIALQQKIQSKGMRTSVSAEVYGAFNKKEAFQARHIEKSSDQKQRIAARLMQSFMFQALDSKERDIVIGAMEEKKYQPGDYIIRQGEDGNELYVVDQGELECYKKFKKDQDDVFLKVYKPGESFGELALLYNAPRAASIKARGEAILFALDRATFNNIVKDAAVKQHYKTAKLNNSRKREKYENILKGIEILASMDPYERTHVYDGLKEEKYKAGDIVIREGDVGDKFYMIEEGSLVAQKKNSDTGENIDVYKYKSGDYFGELALLNSVPRQATVLALTECTLAYLDQSAFKRLLGPIEGILKRNQGKYEKFVKK